MAEAATGTLTVRVPGYPNPIQFADWTHDRLFHTVQFQAGDTNEVQAFVGARGAPIPNGTRVLTLVDTNIPRSGDNGLSEGWEALIYAIEIQIVREVSVINQGQPALLDVAGAQLSRPAHVGGGDPSYLAGGTLFDFLRKTYVRFSVNQKVKSEGPAEKYPQGSGISVFGTSTDLEVANNGIPSPRDARAFVLPVWLQANIQFLCQLNPQAALGPWVDWSGLNNPRLAIDVRVSLSGLLKRPVI